MAATQTLKKNRKPKKKVPDRWGGFKLWKRKGGPLGQIRKDAARGEKEGGVGGRFLGAKAPRFKPVNPLVDKKKGGRIFGGASAPN